jgi:hypothetical protein
LVNAALLDKLLLAVIIPELLLVKVPPLQVKVAQVMELLLVKLPPLTVRLFEPRFNIPLFVVAPPLLENEEERVIVPVLVNVPALFVALPFMVKVPLLVRVALGDEMDKPEQVKVAPVLFITVQLPERTSELILAVP